MSAAFIWKISLHVCMYACMNESIDKLTRKHQNCNFILAGDFNLPGIEWTDDQGTILSNPTYGYNLNENFIDVLNNRNLE